MLDRYEYGYAYWISPAQTTGQQRFFGVLQAESGETIEEYRWQLPFMNAFGKDGWTIWRDWQIDHTPGHWVYQRVTDKFGFEVPFALHVACLRRQS